MGWLQDRWGKGGVFGWAGDTVKRNRNEIGDVLKYGSMLAAPFTGGASMAALVGGLGGAAGTAIKEGTNFGDIAKGGVVGAGTGYAGHSLGQAFGAGSGNGGGATMNSLGFGDIAADVGTEAVAAAPKSLASRAASTIGNIGSDLGSWAAKHPDTLASAFTAIGNAPVNAAQAKRLAMLNEQDEYEMQRRRARDQALNPIWQALAGQAQGYVDNARGPSRIAANPYG